MSPPFSPGRFLAFPALVVVVGVTISTFGFVQMQADARDESIRQVSEFGEELRDHAQAQADDAVEIALTTEGLFESVGEVAAEEFAHFVNTVEAHDGGRVGYAPRVEALDLRRFITDADFRFPSVTMHDTYDQRLVFQAERVYWPLIYRSGTSRGGFLRGYDFGSNPAIAQAIQASLVWGKPAASPLLAMPGDEDSGALVIVSVVGEHDIPVGLAVVTFQLDQLLAEEALEMGGPSVEVSVDQNPFVTGPAPEGSWTGRLSIAGQAFTMSVDNYHPAEVREFGTWLLALGTAMSLLLGWVIYGRSRRNAMRRRLGNLERQLADKDRFLAGISHAIRTPMTSIVGALEILNDNQIRLDGPARASLLHDARVSALDLERLTEDYLTAARISSGAFTLKAIVVDLDILVERIIGSLDIPQGVSVTVEPLGRCQGDLIRIQQIIRNLVRNATQHALTTITIRSRIDGEFVHVEVSNNGQPVPDEIVAEKLFTPFGREMVPTQPESIGLGLSVGRDLARIMGGDLTYRYVDGHVIFDLSLLGGLPVTGSRSTGRDSPPLATTPVATMV